MDHSDHMSEAVGIAVAAIRGADPARVGAPTPSPPDTVGQLLNPQAVGLLLAQLSAERTDLDPSITNYDDAPYLVGHPGSQWAQLAADQGVVTARAWSDAAAWEGETTMAGHPMPAAAIGSMMTTEFVLHGWDLATATGQPFAVPEPLAATVLQGVEAIVGMGRDGGWFGPEVPVAETAPTLARALAAAGRNPSWTPPAA